MVDSLNKIVKNLQLEFINYNGSTKPSPRPERDRVVAINEWNTKFLSNGVDLNGRRSYKNNIIILDKSHICTKPLFDLKPITLKDMKIPIIHEGSYLICRTITNFSTGIETHVLVEDSNGDVEHLRLLNFYEILSEKHDLNPGTLMLIHEPYLKYGVEILDLEKQDFRYVVEIFCDSPSNVSFLDHIVDYDLLKRSNALDWGIHDDLSFKELKKKAKATKDFQEKIRFYKRALAKNDVELDSIYSEMAEIYLQLGDFYNAYKYSKSAMDLGEDREACLLRLGIAAYQMREWQKSYDHFSDLLESDPSNTSAQEWLSKADSRLNEAYNGSFDICQFYHDAMNAKDNKIFFEIADYLGPGKVESIPGKGKGLVAEKDITKGTLLMVSKAFAISEYDPEVVKNLIQCNIVTNSFGTGTKVKIVGEVAKVIQKNPHRSKELYQMFAGDLPRDDQLSDGTIDATRIRNIHRFNAFKHSFDFNKEKAQGEENTAIWVVPAYMNHSCIPNASYAYVGDLMIVHAKDDIKQGEEITISYVGDPFLPYEKRQTILKNYSFKCCCPLCQVDRSDAFCEFREYMLQEFFDTSNKFMSKPPSQWSEQTVMELYGAIESLEANLYGIKESYHARPELKLRLYRPLVQLAYIHRLLGQHPQAMECIEEAMEILPSALELEYRPELHLYLSRSYRAMSDKELYEKHVQKAIELCKTRMGINDELARQFLDLAK